MVINRVWAMPNRWTFKIPPIAKLLARYVGDGKGWVDPFSGESTLAEYRNDMNSQMVRADSHMDAYTWVNTLEGKYWGCLFDPPYSLDQITRSYKDIGLKSPLGFAKNGALDPTGNWKILKDKIAWHIEPLGYAICFGWNSGGFGRGRGFNLEEILLVCHGANHNDTICTVERKIQTGLED